jgi:hypothetical protein
VCLRECHTAHCRLPWNGRSRLEHNVTTRCTWVD